MQVAKTGSGVVFTSDVADINVLVKASGGVTVSPGNTLSLQGQFKAGNYGYDFSGGPTTNNGSILRPGTATAANTHLTTGAFTNNGTFSTTTTMPVNLTVDGDFVNSSTATFDNTADGDLFFNGNFRNDQPDPAKAKWSTSTATSTVTFGGSENTEVRNAASYLVLDCNAAVAKGEIDKTVTLYCGLNLQKENRTLNITSGTLVTNGRSIFAYQPGCRVTGGPAGRLRITDAFGAADLAGEPDASSVNVLDLFQGPGGLKEVIQEGTGTLTIDGTHSLHYSSSGNTFTLKSGVVSYTGLGAGANSALYLSSGSALLSPPDASGWLATGGTASFSGNIYAEYGTEGYASVFQAQSPAAVRFTGSQPATIELAGTNSPSGPVWSFGDLKVQKTSSSLTVGSSNALREASVVAGSVTVNSGSTLNLAGDFDASHCYDITGGVTNNGALAMLAGTNNNLYVGGGWSGTGVFTHAGKPVTFYGDEAATISIPNSSFYDLAIRKGSGSLSMSGAVKVENDLSVESGSFLVGPNTLTLGTGDGSGSVTVQSGATFSAVGTTGSGLPSSLSGDMTGVRTDALATVTAAAESRPFSFTVEDGGTIAAGNARFLYPGTNGVYVAKGAIIAPAPDNFSCCSFDHGAITGPMLRIENEDAFTIANPDFNGTAPQGSAFNLQKTATSGRIDVAGGTGTRWGEAFDADENDLIVWHNGSDAACLVVFAPTGFVDSGASVTPACSVHNYGTNAASFDVKMNIGTAVGTARVDDLAPGTGKRVNLSPDLVANVPPGRFSVKCSTRLDGDQDQENDRQGPYDILVVKRDVRPVSVVAPSGTYAKGTEIRPEAVWQNEGNLAAEFVAWMIVSDPTDIERYRCSKEVNAGAGPGRAVSVLFDDVLIPDRPGTWTIRCSTAYQGDMLPDNDQIVSEFDVTTRDVAVASVVTPTPGKTYLPGEALVPEATWKSYSTSEPADFWAWMTIFEPEVRSPAEFSANQPGTALNGLHYRDSLFVTGLAAGRDTSLQFSPAKPLTFSGTWTVRCSTFYTGDLEPEDDTVSSWFTVGAPDIEVVSIIAPAGAVETSAVVLPKALLANRGDCILTFQARFTIWSPADGPGSPTYDETVVVGGLEVGAESTVVFSQFRPSGMLGAWTARCTVLVSGDRSPDNDAKYGAFDVTWPLEWLSVTDMTSKPSEKATKDGAWLAVGPDGPKFKAQGSMLETGASKSRANGGKLSARSVIYAAKGNKSYDFYKYYPAKDSWVTLLPIPDTEPTLGKPKPLSKGSCAVSDGKDYLYMLKGNNTQGFWRYRIEDGKWDTLTRSPQKIKGGNDVAYVNHNGKEYVYLLAGGKTAFFRFDIESGLWTEMESVPYGGNKKKYGAGSFLVYDGLYTIYAHQANVVGPDSNHYMYRYDLADEKWDKTEYNGLPWFGTEDGSEGKKKKSKDGAAGAWHLGKIYALKGGGSQGFYQYNPGADMSGLNLRQYRGQAQAARRR